MKKILSCFKIAAAGLLVISQLSFLGQSPVLAAGATLSLSPANGTFNRGCSFSVDVVLDTGGTNTDGTDSIIFYDPTRLLTTVTDIKNGTIYSDYPGNVVDSSAGKMNISGMSSISSGFSGAGVLATINFKVPDNAPTGAFQLKFDFDPTDKAKTSDSNVAERGTVTDVLNQVNDGSYTIGTGSCGGTTIVSPMPGKGGPVSTSSAITPPSKSPPQFPPKAPGASAATLIVAAVGGVLTILGLLGLVLL